MLTGFTLKIVRLGLVLRRKQLGQFGFHAYSKVKQKTRIFKIQTDVILN